MVVAGIAYGAGESAIHSGKETITGILFTNDKYLHWYTPLTRIVGSIFSFTTGAAGGVFAPALSSGAAIGSVLSHLFVLSPTGTNLLALSGMVAFLTGATRSPFASAILVLEMTDGHSVIFILMLAALAANLSAYFIDKHSFYDHIKMSYIKTFRSQ
jgi:H+/Cl- antiporter ClcA